MVGHLVKLVILTTYPRMLFVVDISGCPSLNGGSAVVDRVEIVTDL